MNSHVARLEPAHLSRLDFYGGTYTRCDEYFPYSVYIVLNEISRARYRKTLLYDSSTPVILAHFQGEELVWEEGGDNVVGLIEIHYSSPEAKELIWITNTFLERGYFQYILSEEMKSIISKAPAMSK